MKIYTVSEHFVVPDSDHYYHYLDSSIVSYHISRKSAEKQINILLEKEWYRVSNSKNVNAEHLQEIECNFARFELGGYDFVEKPIFFIGEVEVKE